MATLIAKQTGNWTSSSTWGVADTTMLQEALQAVTNTTTGNQDSLGFTTGAITVDAMVVFGFRQSSTGTITFSLWNSTDSTTAASVTINATDLPAQSTTLADSATSLTLEFGSVTLLAGKSYKLRITASSANNAAFYRSTANSTAWDVMLRTTTTGTPAANDRLVIGGNWTAAATHSAVNVTMDETATTSYGLTSYSTSIWVGSKGTLAYGTSASTNYYLKFKGTMRVGGDGTCTIGTSATPTPSTSSAVLEMASVAKTDTGVVVSSSGTWNTGGNPLTYDRALVNASAGGICSTSTVTVTRLSGPVFTGLTGTIYINGTAYTISSVTNANTLVLTGSAGTLTQVGWVPATTTLTTDVTTGWKSGDEIAMCSETRSAVQHEKKSLSVDASGTTITFATSIQYPKSATAPQEAELMNLTRNVKIRGMSTSLTGYLFFRDGAIVDRSWDETYYLGSSTTGKYGVEVGPATGFSGTYSEDHCSNHDYISASGITEGSAFRASGGTLQNCTITDSNYWNAGYVQFFSAAANYANCSFTGIMIGANLSNQSYGFYTANAINAVITDITTFGNTTGFYISTTSATAGANVVGTLDNIKSKNGGGISLTNITGSVGDLYSYRGTGHGLTMTTCRNLIIDSMTGTGHASSSLAVNDNMRCVLKSFSSNSDTINQPYGMYIVGPNIDTIICGDGGGIGTVTANGTSDIVFTGGANCTIIFHNMQFGSTTEVSLVNSWLHGAAYSNMNYDGTTGDHREIRWEGTLQNDTTVYYGVSGQSLRMTPTRANYKLESSTFFVPVESGDTATFQVQVRKSSVGDTGTAYTGAQPRLMIRANPSAGITSDTVIATYSAGTGSWNTLSGSSPTVSQNCILEFYVDCGGDGTNVPVGSVFVDEVACGVPNPSSLDFFRNGVPYADGIVLVTPTSIFLPYVGG
jgi:hypothetical protein